MNTMQMYDNVLTESTDLVSFSKDSAANQHLQLIISLSFLLKFFFFLHQIDLSVPTSLPAISSFWSSPYINCFLSAAFQLPSSISSPSFSVIILHF